MHANVGSTSGLVTAAVRGSTSSEVAELKRQVQQLKAAICFKWMKGVFCSTHGWGVSEDHDRITCIRKGAGHITTSTRSNPAGPDATKNIGWDEFWS